MALAREGLEKVGLRRHAAERVSDDMEALGGRRTGSPPTSRLTRKRYWRLYDGLTFLVDSLGRATSRQLEVLIGHITFAGLFRRESLSVLCASYEFVRKDFKVAEPLWGSVMRELRTFKGLLILLERRMDQQWSTDVWASDACETGHASVQGRWALETVQSVGPWQERWRFKIQRTPAGNA